MAMITALSGCFHDHVRPEPAVSQLAKPINCNKATTLPQTPLRNNDFTLYYRKNGNAIDLETSEKETGRTLTATPSGNCAGDIATRPNQKEFERLFEKHAFNKRKINSGQDVVLGEQFDSNGNSKGYECVKSEAKTREIVPLEAVCADGGHACQTGFCPFYYLGVEYCRRC